MRERSTTCLRHGSQRLRQLPERCIQTRRLHTDFWRHGAADIDLPAWWLDVLKSQDSLQPRKKRYVEDKKEHTSWNNASSTFMDFLYPPMTQSFLHNLASRHATSVQRRRKFHTSIVRNAEPSEEPKIPALSQNARKLERRKALREIMRQKREIENRDVEKTLVSEAKVQEKLYERDAGDRFEDEEQDPTEVARAMPVPEDILGKISYYKNLHSVDSAYYQGMLATVTIDDPGWNRKRTRRELDVAMDRLVETSKIYLQTMCERALDLTRRPPQGPKIDEHYAASIAASIYAENYANFENDLHNVIEKDETGLTKWTRVAMRYLFKLGNPWIGRYAAKVYASFSSSPRPFIAFWRCANESTLRTLIMHGLETSKLMKVDEVPQAWHPYFYSLVKYILTLRSNEKLEVAEGETSLSNPLGDLWKLYSAREGVSPDDYYEYMRFWLVMPGRSRQREIYTRRAFNVYSRLRETHPDVAISVDVIRDLFNESIKQELSYNANVLMDDLCYYSEPEPQDYDNLLQLFSSKNASREFFALWEQRRASFGPPESIEIYYPLLAMHRQLGQAEQLENIVIDTLPSHNIQPDVHCFNELIAAYVKRDQPDMVRQWHEKLQQSGLEPDERTITLLMRNHAARGETDMIINSLAECERTGIQIHADMIGALIQSHLNNGQVGPAEKLVLGLHTMSLEGPVTDLWNKVLVAYAWRKRLAKVRKLRQRMKDVGIPQDRDTYSALLLSLCRVGQPFLAQAMLKLEPTDDLKLAAFDYALVMSSYLDIRQPKLALEVYHDMLKQNIEPDWSVNHLLVRVAADLDLVEHNELGMSSTLEKAEEFLSSLLENPDLSHFPSAETPSVGLRKRKEFQGASTSLYFEHLIMIYGRTDMTEAALRIYDRYIETSPNLLGQEKVTPPWTMLSTLMDAFNNQENHSATEELWKAIWQSAPEVTAKTNADLTKDDWVLPSRRGMLGRPFKVYAKSLVLQGRYEDLQNALEMLGKAGFVLNNDFWCYYIKVLYEAGDLEQALMVAEREIFAHKHSSWQGWIRIPGNRWKLYDWLRWRSPHSDVVLDPRRFPTYEVIVYLAAAWSDYRSLRTFSDGGKTEMEDLASRCPATIDAVIFLPKIDDPLQVRLLNKY